MYARFREHLVQQLDDNRPAGLCKADRQYWAPLFAELQRLRAARKP